MSGNPLVPHMSLLRRLTFSAALVAAASILSACDQVVQKSANPTSPLIAGPISGVGITAPGLSQPSGGTRFAVDQQPLTLVVQNSTTNGVRTVYYAFQVAADSGFATVLVDQDGVAAGSAGFTSFKLPSALTPERTYYWRVQARDGANRSDYSGTASFTVYTPVVLQAPTLVSPINSAVASTRTPDLTWTNATRTGPAGAVTYAIQVATDQGFSSVIASWTAAEGSASTTTTVPTTLSYDLRYYWRVRAVEPSVTGPWSSTQTFLAPATPVVIAPPAPSPTPTPSACSASNFNPNAAVFYNNPPIGRWAETSCITRVDFSSGYVVVDFDKRQGGGKWPEVPFGDGGGGTIQYTLGLCFLQSGQWQCSAAIQFWDGRELIAGGSMNEIGINWYYDQRWGIMSGHQPAIGETVAVFAANGNVRDSTSWSIEQRTNFQLIQWGTNFIR